MKHLKKRSFDSKKIILKFFIGLGVLSPAIFLSIQVISFGSNTPYMDQWELTADFKEIEEGRYGINDLWRQHNEHRLFFPRLIMVLLAHLTDWNIRFELMVNLLFAFAMLVTILLLVRSLPAITKNAWVYALALLISSVLVFSFTQAENWLWGWQMQWYMACFGFLLTIYLLNRNKLPKVLYIAAIVAAVFATYSLGNGMIAWLVGLGILYVHSHKIRYWVVAALATIGSYYIGFRSTGLETPLSELIIRPYKPIAYFFAYIGRPISENKYIASVAGLAGIIIVILCLWVYLNKTRGQIKEKIKPIIVPVSLIIFVIMSAGITALSRSSLGVGQALASRYTTVSSLFWIGFVILLVVSLQKVNFKKKEYTLLATTNVLMLCLVIGVVASNRASVFFGQHAGLIRGIKQCTQLVDLTDDCLLKTYPRPEKARRDIEYLRERGWAGYEDIPIK